MMTANNNSKHIEEVLDHPELITEAIRKGAREAMKQYIAADQPMVSWKDGKIVKIPPHELKKMLKADN